MKVAEILLLCPDLLKILHKSGIKTCDYKYIGMYREYLDMRKDGCKITYIVLELAKRYGCSERFVYKYIKRLEQDCTIGAVE